MVTCRVYDDSVKIHDFSDFVVEILLYCERGVAEIVRIESKVAVDGKGDDTFFLQF